MEIKIDPEFESKMRPLTQVEVEHLEDLLKEQGCQYPLLVWKEEGILIDGHNRFKICSRLNIPFKTTDMSFPTRDSAIAYLMKIQVGRRNETKENISIFAAEIANLKVGNPQLATSSYLESPQLATSSYLEENKQISQKDAAEMFGISVSSLKHGKQILDYGSEELIEAVKNNQITIYKALRSLSFPKEQQLEEAKKPGRGAIKGLKLKTKEFKIKEEKPKVEKPKTKTREELFDFKAIVYARDAIGKLHMIRKEQSDWLEALNFVEKWIIDFKNDKID